MADAPPSYAQATGSSTASGPKPAAGIPISHRRSMEDEHRPLPAGWLRRFDAKSQHQFYVDTRAQPPRSIWHHPYDDDQYLGSLSSEERERIEEQNAHPTRADILSMSSSESLRDHAKNDSGVHHSSTGGAGVGNSQDPYSSTTAAAGPSGSRPPPKGLKKFGRDWKDKLTGTTHEQRAEERRQRDIQEQREYEMHLRLRRAMARAAETGQPQLVGRDQNGKEVYVEPPAYDSGWGYSPYAHGPYTNTPNATYIRPPGGAYGRPYGYGYGGGLGLPIAGGLLGGALLGGLLF